MAKHAEFDAETPEYVFDALISGERLPSALRESTPGSPACKLLCPSVSESDGGGSALLD